MLAVVPSKDPPAEADGVFLTSEALRELWAILDGLEVRFGKWVVV